MTSVSMWVYARIAAKVALCTATSLTVTHAQAGEIISISSVARPIYAHIFGYNSDYYYTTNPWSLAKRRAAAVKSRPGMLRYPGGTSANYWDAYHSRIFQDALTINPADTNPAQHTRTRYTINWIHNAYFWTNVTPLSDFTHLQTALRAGGADVGTIFVANLITPGADFWAAKWNRTVDNTPGSADWWTMLGHRYGALDFMLQDAVKNQIPVRYVELGNEYYFGAGLTRADKPADVEPYSAGSFDADDQFSPENVGAFPDKTPDGKGALYLYGVVANDWAAKIKKSYPGVKVCVVGNFVDKDGYAPRTKNWNREALAALDPAKVDAVSLHLYGGPRAGSLTDNEEKLGQALASWRDFWIAGRTRSSLPPKLDWWVTEFNIDDEFGNADTLPESKGTWGNGLGNLFCLHYWLQNEPRVKVTLLHELARVIVEDGPDIKAHGRAYGLFSRAATGHTRARAVNLRGVPALAGSSGKLRGVVGWAFDTPGKKSAAYALVNFSGTSQAMRGLSRLPGAKNGRYTQAASALKTLADPGETSGAVSGLRNSAIVLPAYSVTLIEGVLP